MVGVPKSTGCKICRTRKIKCDETWPTCVNCRKNGKECPGPPDRYTIKQQRSKNNACPRPKSEEGTAVIVRQYSNSPMTEVRRTATEDGSVTHVFRIPKPERPDRRRPPRWSMSQSSTPPKSPLPRSPSLSDNHELACALITATTTGHSGHRMSVFGPFIKEVPARIGHNAALDAAVAVLVNAHTSLIHKKTANEIVSPHLYLKAIKTLQSCLEDREEGMSANTLCASVLLGLVEALAGPRTGNRYLAHVGGAGRLMELQGPAQYHDKFAKEILRFNRGGIIVTAIYERRPCFLTLPEWKDIAFDKTGLSFDDCLNTDLVQQMAELPGILKDVKELKTQHGFQPSRDLSSFSLGMNSDDKLSDTGPPLDYSPNSFESLDYIPDLHHIDTPYPVSTPEYPHSSARSAVLQKIQILKDSLYDLGCHMNNKLSNGVTAIELPAIELGTPIPLTYHFSTWRDMTSYSIYWSMVIMTNKVLMKLLPPFDPVIYDLQAECRSVALEICKTWEDAWASKPIGALHTGLSFVVAYEFCEPEVQAWIIKSLNSLLDYQMVDAFRWSDEIIEMMSGKLTGEGPDLIFSTVKVSREAS